MLRAKSFTVNVVADVTGFPDLHINRAVFAFHFQMAVFIQPLWRRKMKTSSMLPPVAAVLPAEKGNETLVKWDLLPCCRFSYLNLAFLARFTGLSRPSRFPGVSEPSKRFQTNSAPNRSR
jgi:hypothetical protein